MLRTMPNLNLIPAKKVYSEAEMTNAMIAELCSGRRFTAECERFREQDAAQQARKIREHAQRTTSSRFHKSKAFKHVGCIPDADFKSLATDDRYRGCWDDDGFVRDFFKRHSHLKTANL